MGAAEERARRNRRAAQVAAPDELGSTLFYERVGQM